jgi:uncharacterized protein
VLKPLPQNASKHAVAVDDNDPGWWMSEAEYYVARSSMPAGARTVFDWHRRPGALARLNPPFDSVEVLEHADDLSPGGRTVLRIHLGPIPRRWVATTTAVENGVSFSDRQLSGPFAAWDHTHRVVPDGPERSWLEDVLSYRLPFGQLGRLAASRAVRAKLESLFAYRHALVAADLARHRALPGPGLRVGVSGSHGLIGTALTDFLTTGGHNVERLPRHAPAPQALEGLDAVVHLAGASVGKRWSNARKVEIRRSRVESTASLVEAMRRCSRPPPVLLSASAIGIYGDRGSDALDETSALGSGFLADVCRGWEAAALGAESFGARVVLLRTGLVLSPNGGALQKLVPVFRACLGGRVGPGTQVYSWVALEDVVGAIHFALRTPTVRGPLNLTAPEAATNGAFTQALGEVLHRPTPAPFPSAAVRAIFGEMGRETLLASARVTPRALLESGFTFRWPGLGGALRFCLGIERLPSAA